MRSLCLVYLMARTQPLTNALTKVQADYHPLSGKTSTGRRRLGLWEMIKRTWREEGGWKGVLRG